MGKELENQEITDREKLRIRLIDAYKAYHYGDPKTQNLADNYSSHPTHPFFVQLSTDIREDLNFLVEIPPRWFRDVFNYDKGLQTSRLKIITKYIEEADKIILEREKIDNTPNYSSDIIEAPTFEEVTLASLSNPPFEETTNSISIVKGAEEFSGYFNRLKEEFKTIRLSVASFEMPIEYFIKTPLLENDSILKKELIDLKEEKASLLEDKKRIDKLSNRIKKIEDILNEKHDIIDVINIGKDIFIQASAGSGKSTMLRWLTYQFATESYGFFPIFVELMYNTNNDLKTLIEESCEISEFRKVINQNRKIVLFLDGFDQFTGNKVKLFKDINTLKNNQNLLIVFSGREIPNTSKHKLDLIVYSLLPFDISDIKKVTIAYLGEIDGNFYNDYIISKKLERYINKPLYLCFLLAHIKRLINKGVQPEEIITTLNITNKGKLLKYVVVDYFIGEYEEDLHHNLSTEQWKVEKLQQLELINFIAHHMTFNLKDAEVIEWKKAIDLIKLYYNKNSTLKRIDADYILNEFIKHNILHLQNGKLSFDKKELRLFFTVLFLKEKVNSFKKLKKYKKIFLRKVHNEQTWASMQYYLIGLVDPNPFLSSFKKINFNEPIIINTLLLEQFNLSLEFIEQKNFPSIRNHINKKYLIATIKLVLEKYYSSKYSSKYSLLNVALSYLVRFIIIKTKIPNRYIPIRVENVLNYGFFNYEFPIKSSHHMTKLISNLYNYDLGLNFFDLIKIVETVEDEDFTFKRHVYDAVLRQEDVSIRLSSEESALIIFDYLFNFEHSEKYSKMFKYKSSGLFLFSIKVLENYSGQFFNLFFKKIDTIKNYKIKRFACRIFNGGNGTYLTFKHGILLPRNADKLFEYTKKICLKNKYFGKFNYILENSTDTYLIDLFMGFFKKVLLDKLYSKKEQSNAFQYLFSVKRPTDIKFLLDAFKNNNQEIIEITFIAIENRYIQEYRLQKKTLDKNLINLYCEILESEKCSLNIKQNIIRNIKYTDNRLNEIIIRIFKSNDDYLLTSIILDFFGHFKIKDAIPLMESLLKSSHGLNSLKNLYEIDYSFYKKYCSLFKKEYNETLAFLTVFSFSKSFTPQNKVSLFDAVYVGDSNILKMFNSIKENMDDTIDYRDRMFFNSLMKELEKKCFAINNIKEKPSTFL